MKRKIYIATKITGVEEWAEKLLDHVESTLKTHGFEVVNPMKLNHNHDKSHESYMKVCLPALEKCTLILLVGDWKNSKGAKDEFIHATLNKIPYILEAEMDVLKYADLYFNGKMSIESIEVMVGLSQSEIYDVLMRLSSTNKEADKVRDSMVERDIFDNFHWEDGL